MDWFQEITQNVADAFEETGRGIQDAIEETGRGVQDALDDTGKSLQMVGATFGLVDEEELKKQEEGPQIADLEEKTKQPFEVRTMSSHPADVEEDLGRSRVFDIHFRFSLKGQEFKLENLNAMDTVRDLKQQVQQKTGMPLAKQHLYFCGTLLVDDSKSLYDYRIHKEPVNRTNLALLPRYISLLQKADPVPKESQTKPAKSTVKVSPPAPVRDNRPPLPVALLFPGQGSQYTKMLADVKDMHAVKELLTTAKRILGYDLLDLCLNGPEAKLEETRYCQPAMFVAGLAAVEKLRQDQPEKVDRVQAVAGLSLGEYTALTVAGVFTFEDGLKLVAQRGQFMHEAAEGGNQGMLSVAGLEQKKVEELCARAQESSGKGEVCCVSNVLFPKGYSCAGTKRALFALKKLSEEEGAMQARMLKTSGAFHTSLMAPAKLRLEKALKEVQPRMNPPRCAVYFNVTGQSLPAGTDPKQITPLLLDQLTGSVLWEPSIRKMLDDNVDEFFECGPMKQLKAMMKRIDMKAHNKMTNIAV